MKMMITALFTILTGTAAFAHSGHGGHLSFGGGKIHAHLSWDQGPDENGGESILRLEWRDGATHAFVEPGVPFEVSLWMPSMGHGSAPTQIQRVADGQGGVLTGVYQVRNVYFIMPGDWDIRVTLKPEGGTAETQIWSVSIGGDGHGGHHH